MTYLCPDCGRRLEVFGHGSGEWLAEEIDPPLLGQIPLDPAICAIGEAGQPATEADAPIGRAVRELVGKVAGQLGLRQFAIVET